MIYRPIRRVVCGGLEAMRFWAAPGKRALRLMRDNLNKRLGSPECPVVHPTLLISLHFWLLLGFAHCYGQPWCKVGKGRIEMAYVLATLAIGVAALVGLPEGSAWQLVPLYLVVELMLFISLFVDRGTLIDPAGSLKGFLLNVVGMVVFFAAAFLSRGCLKDSRNRPGWTAAYASFRTFTTLGSDNLRECTACQLLVVWEGAMAYILTAVIIGGVAGLVVAGRK